MKVKFVPQNIEFEISPDQSVMKLAHKNGVYIKSICGGLPSCAECRVRVVEGDQNVLPPSSKELNLIGTGYFIDQRRLSCQLKCYGDVTIDMTEQLAKQEIVETRRPQGSKKPENEASHAVSGNLIQQDDALKVVAEEVSRREHPGGSGGQGPRRDGGGRGPRGQGGGREGREVRDGRDGGGRNRQGRSNSGGSGGRGGGQGGHSGGQQQSGRGQGSASGNPNTNQNSEQNQNHSQRNNSGPRHNNRGGGQQGRRDGGQGGGSSNR